ncbi:MAG: protein kinase [Nanoarchaeota archaeon]|nr:protein kinase [Nanoarchaeota archaeon]
MEVKLACNIYVDFELVRAVFEPLGITNLQYVNSHATSYATGHFEGKQAGVKFGFPLSSFYEEARTLSKLSHESIPRCYTHGKLAIPNNEINYQAWTEKEKEKDRKQNVTNSKEISYLVLQHCPGTELDKNLKFETKQDKEKALDLFSKIIDVMTYLNSKNIVHGELYYEHILVNKNDIYLIDFSEHDEVLDEDYLMQDLPSRFGDLLQETLESDNLRTQRRSGPFWKLFAFAKEMTSTVDHTTRFENPAGYLKENLEKILLSAEQ